MNWWASSFSLIVGLFIWIVQLLMLFEYIVLYFWTNHLHGPWFRYIFFFRLSFRVLSHSNSRKPLNQWFVTFSVQRSHNTITMIIFWLALTIYCCTHCLFQCVLCAYKVQNSMWICISFDSIGNLMIVFGPIVPQVSEGYMMCTYYENCVLQAIWKEM